MMVTEFKKPVWRLKTMTDANKMCATIMRELNNLVISDTDEGETKEEQRSFLFHEEEVS